MGNSKKFSREAGDCVSGRRGRPREFDREKAVNIAMEVFWKNGYTQTTLGDLCRAMGITAPSFYCAFSTRENLFLETVDHYRKLYWDDALARLMLEKDVYTAIENFLIDAVKIYMRPNLPKGCFLDISTVGLPPEETRIARALELTEKNTIDLFRRRLMRGIEAGQLPPDSGIPAITGALIVFLKGIAAMARKDLCQAELLEIAARGLLLLPARLKKA